jgi:hypothetical protein
LDAPLRYLRLPDGVIVYSVGIDKNDDGGKIERRFATVEPFEGIDVGFRLWNPDKRRQKAKGP